MNTEEIFQQVMNENCKDPLHRFAELVRKDEREKWDTSDMAHRAGGLSVEQAEKQELVCDKDPHLCWSVRCQLGKVCKNTAPPKREWVGLTDEEIHKIIDDCTPDEAELEELNDFAKAIFAVEAKLKERNT